MPSPSIEIQFAQKLAVNEPALRDKALKKLRKWLSGNKSLSLDEMLRLWKGLYYCFWMSDKPLIQEELSEKISELISVFGSNNALALSYVEAFLKTMNREWFGIDRWRMDKFLMLSRRFLRASLNYLKSHSWNSLSEFMSIIQKEILSKKTGNDLGFRLHFIEIFLEEVSKVGGQDFELCDTFLEVFIHDLAFGNESRIQDQVVKHIFHHLIKQSDLALAYESYRRGELPSDSEDEESMDEDETNLESDENNMEEDDNDMGEEEDDGDEEKEELGDGPLDPRAGKVNVTLNQLILDFSHTGDLLFEYGSKKEVKRTNRKSLYDLSKMYKAVSEGSYPFAIIEDEEDIQKMKAELDELDVNKLAAQKTKKDLKAIKRNSKNKKAMKEYIKNKQLGVGNEEEEEDGEMFEDSGSEIEMDDDEDLSEEEDKENAIENEEESENDNECIEEEEEGEEEVVEEPVQEIGKKRKRNASKTNQNVSKQKRIKMDESVSENGDKPSLVKKKKNLVRIQNRKQEIEGNEKPTKKNKKKLVRIEENDNNETIPNAEENESPSESILLNIKLKGKSKKSKSKNSTTSSSTIDETDNSESSSLFVNNDDWDDDNSSTSVIKPVLKTPSPKLSSHLLDSLQTASESKILNPRAKKARKLSLPSTSSKKVNFAMTKNKHQSIVQHHKSIVSSPEIPFLPNKKPKQGVLKVKGEVPETLPSPNPKVLARNTILNAKSKAAKLLFRSGMSNYFQL